MTYVDVLKTCHLLTNIIPISLTEPYGPLSDERKTSQVPLMETRERRAPLAAMPCTCLTEPHTAGTQADYLLLNIQNKFHSPLFWQLAA